MHTIYELVSLEFQNEHDLEYKTKFSTLKRRDVQKYCSNSCRSNPCRIGKQNNTTTTKTEQMSLSSVGNATVGVILVNTPKSTFTKEDNKPATKGDIKLLSKKLQARYHLIQNMTSNINGEYPYFDLETNLLVYLII